MLHNHINTSERIQSDCIFSVGLLSRISSILLTKQLKLQEQKPVLMNNQCVVYPFKCDQCDADYIGYHDTTQHFHQRIQEHKTSVVGKDINGSSKRTFVSCRVVGVKLN